MKRNILIAITFLLLSPQFLYADTPPVQQWAIDYNGPANGDDYSCDIVIDNLCNVYVTGRSDDNNAVPDYATIKYAPDGNKLWVERYNGPGNSDDYAQAIALDNTGNIYVTGTSASSGTRQDYATIKYDTNGVQKWGARYNNEPENKEDCAYAIAVDCTGNVYVTGESWGGETSFDYATIKYDSNGIQKWATRYNGPDNDSAQAMALDNTGNIYVTGTSIGDGTREDYATLKYDPNGNELWVARYNGTENSKDYAQAIAVDNSGNVYVTGSSDSSTDVNYATIKYDPDGNELWVASYNGTGNSEDYAQAIALDSAGNIYVTGTSIGSGTNYDYATLKYDTNGVQKWIARFDGQQNLEDYAQAIALDSENNVYVTGSSWDSNTSFDYATIKYDPNGNQEWVMRYNGPEALDDCSQAIAADNMGNVYVTGYSYNSAAGSDYMTIKYTQHNYCTSIAGDLNGNCKVDFADYAILTRNWPTPNGWEDLAALADNWLKCGYALQEDCW